MLLHNLLHFNLEIRGCMTNIQMIFESYVYVLKHIVDYHSHSVPYACFQVLKIVVYDLVDGVRDHLNHIMPGNLTGRGVPIARPPFDFFLCDKPRLPGQKQ